MLCSIAACSPAREDAIRDRAGHGDKRPDALTALLAPLAVHLDWQARRVGSHLIAEGFDQLARAGVKLVFVLGNHLYNRRFGIAAAGPRGLAVPNPLSARYAQARMAKELRAGALDAAGTYPLRANVPRSTLPARERHPMTASAN